MAEVHSYDEPLLTHDHEAGVEEVGPVDELPSDGVFRDWNGAQLEPRVVERGEQLGAGTPDVDYVEGEDGTRRELQ